MKGFWFGMEAYFKQFGRLITAVSQCSGRIRNRIDKFVDTSAAFPIGIRIELLNPAVLKCYHHQSLTPSWLHGTNTYPAKHLAVSPLIVNHAADLNHMTTIVANHRRCNSTVTIIVPIYSDFSKDQRSHSYRWFKLIVDVLLNTKNRFKRMFGNVRSPYFSESNTLVEVGSAIAGDKKDVRRKSCHS